MRYQFPFRALIAVCIVLFGMNALAQDLAPNLLSWAGPLNYDRGEQTSVAIAPMSNFIIEFHKSQNNSTMWYHTGKISGTRSGIIVGWGASHSLETTGAWPAVAVTREGYVILVSSPAGQVVSQIRYSVGKINPSGAVDQTITWYRTNQVFGYGYHASISVNSLGRIALAYECRNACIPALDYRLGHLENPASGQYNIVWETGANAIAYDKGVNPHIAINDSDQVIEVHQVDAREQLLHYRRGNLNSDSISFQQSTRYDNNAKDPAVTLTNSGQVIALDIKKDAVSARTGNLDAGNPATVDWSESANIGSLGYNVYNVYPAVTNSGTVVLATWTVNDGSIIGPYGTLQYSVAPLN
jgi:hypothetical protein